jgi:predicted  nucleic acid-binding Zn-ribbon protein
MPFVIDYNAPAAWGGGGALAGYAEKAWKDMQFQAEMSQRQFQNQLALQRQQEEMKQSEFNRKTQEEQLRLQRESVNQRGDVARLYEEGRNQRAAATEEGRNQRQDKSLDFKADQNDKNRQTRLAIEEKRAKESMNRLNTSLNYRKTDREAINGMKNRQLAAQMGRWADLDDQFHARQQQREDHFQQQQAAIRGARADNKMTQLEREKEDMYDNQIGNLQYQLNNIRRGITEKMKMIDAATDEKQAQAIAAEIQAMQTQQTTLQGNITKIYDERDAFQQTVVGRLQTEVAAAQAQPAQTQPAQTQPAQTQPAQTQQVTQNDAQVVVKKLSSEMQSSKRELTDEELRTLFFLFDRNKEKLMRFLSDHNYDNRGRYQGR